MKDQLLDMLQENTKYTLDELCQTLSQPKKKVKNKLKQLVKQGVIDTFVENKTRYYRRYTPKKKKPARKFSSLIPDVRAKIESVQTLLKNHSLLIFMILFLTCLVIQTAYNARLQHLAGPLYGGDYYYHYGHIQHILEGGNIFVSSHYVGEYEHYPWLTHLIIALLAWTLPFKLMTITNVVYPALLTIASTLAMYFLIRGFVQSKTIAALLAFYWLPLFPSFTPTQTASLLFAPIILYAIFHARSKNQRILAGILLGISAIQHLTVFLGGMLAISFLIFGSMFLAFLQQGATLRSLASSPFLRRIKQLAAQYVPMIVPAMSLSLIYLWAPLFYYRMQTLNPWQTYTAGGVSALTLLDVLDQLLHPFLSLGSIPHILFSALAVVGLVFAFRKRMYRFTFLVLLVGIIGYAHPLITLPLLGTSYGHYSYPLFLSFAIILFISVGMFAVYKNTSQMTRFFLTLLFLVLIGSAQYSSAQNHLTSQYVQDAAKENQYQDILYDLGEFIQNTTHVNDVFITTHGESAFALTALTGRKVVYMRRTHSSLYADTDRRVADAVVILYGNNTAKRDELIAKYNVSYYYDDLYARQQRNMCLQQWDNLEQNPESSYACLRVPPEFRPYLKKYNITFKKINARLDISNERAPTFDLLAVKPTLLRIDLKDLRVMNSTEGALAQISNLQ